MNQLQFSFGNAKVKNAIIFDLPAGQTCPGAEKCLAMVKSGKIWDGPRQEFRCYAASIEVLYKNVHAKRTRNLDILKGKTKNEMASIIKESLPIKFGILRIHSSGDFFSQDYFDAWLETIKKNKNILFYAYTKSIPFWLARKDEIPPNFVLTASYGGKFDYLIKEHNLKNAEVVVNPKLKKIDHDDSLAQNKRIKSFRLLLHGSQKAGTKASKDLVNLKKKGIFGYSRLKII